jgi:hypothetical protein
LHDGTFVWSDSGNSVFDSTGANQFLVNAAGGVGINKNNPATALEVNGTVTATSFVGNGSGLTGLNIPDGHSLDASDGSPVDALVLDSNGRVGINKASPTSTLDVNGTVTASSFVGDGSGLTGLNMPDGHSLDASDGSPANRVFVNSAGLIGLGTTSPDSGKTVTIRGDGASSGWIQFQTSAGANEWHLAYAGDGMNFVETDVADARLMLKDGGNVGIGTANPSQKLHVIGNILATGTVTGSSDQNIKENFGAVDLREVLAQVAAMPIQRWNYIGEDTPHLGPVAQDFHVAFKVGMDDRHISMVDADGVALAAIQGLNQKLEERLTRKDREIAALEAQVTELRSLVGELLNR